MSSKAETTTGAKQQLVRFIIVGVFCAVLDFGLTYLLTHAVGLDRVTAKIFGWCLGTAAAYLLNSKFTFEAKITGKRALAVFVLYLSTLGTDAWPLGRDEPHRPYR